MGQQRVTAWRCRPTGRRPRRARLLLVALTTAWPFLVAGTPATSGPATGIASLVRVPLDVPSLPDAVAAVRAGGRVEVAPGTHWVDHPVVLDRAGVAVVGVGDEPVRVLARSAGHGRPASVLHVTAAGVTVAGLRLGGAEVAALHLDGADDARVHDVVVDGDGTTRHGVLVEGTRRASLLDVDVRDARRSGIHVGPCRGCRVALADVEVRRSLVGVEVVGADQVVVVDSTVAAGGVGIVARADPATGAPSRVELRRNVVVDNTSRRRLPHADDPDRRLVVGAGIWLAGAADSLVEGNEVRGHGYGIVLAGGPADRVRVARNVLVGQADADLAWDGLGLGTCFHRNVAGDGGEPSQEPPRLQVLHDCDAPVAPASAWPAVDGRLVARAYG